MTRPARSRSRSASPGRSNGNRNIQWIEKHCRIPEGKFVGQPVRLRLWQRKIIKGIYDGDTRRAIVSFGRKNAKTTLSAFLLLLHLCGPESRPNSQLYSAAQSRDQASILFALAAKIVRMSPTLIGVVGIRDTAKQLYCDGRGTTYRALSADASTAYGLSPVFTVHDELGQVRGPRSDLYDALETASGAQQNPLSIVISTQAPTDGDLLSILIDDAKTGADPRTKIFMFSAGEDMDPFSREAQKAANPALGDFLDAVEVREQAAAAKRMPARESAYRNLVLNQRVNQSSPFIPRAVWSACGSAPRQASLACGTVFVGVDLSARHDLTALAMVSQGEDGAWDTWCEFYAPRDGIEDRSKRDRAPYDMWWRQGHITATPGAAVDYEIIARRLVEISDDYELAAVAFDRWRIDVLQKELSRLGVELPLVPHGQGFKDMAPALDSLEAEIANGRIRHGNNPVLTNCAANAIAVTDPAGNRKLDKAKSTGRIDGMVALAMALRQATLGAQEEPKTYVSDRIMAL